MNLQHVAHHRGWGRNTRLALAIALAVTIFYSCTWINLAWCQNSSPAGPITFTAYTLRHVDAGRAKATIASLLPPNTQIVVDAENNQLVVGATPQGQATARAVISTVDQALQPSDNTQFTSYDCAPGQASHLVGQLQSRFRARPDVTLTADDRQNRITVMAPANIQAEVARYVSGGVAPPSAVAPVGTIASPIDPRQVVPATANMRTADNSVGFVQSPMYLAQNTAPMPVSRPTAPPAQQPSVSVSPAASQTYRLSRLTPTAFESRFRETLGQRAIPVQNIAPEQHMAIYKLPLADGSTLTMTINRTNGDVTLVGETKGVHSGARLVAVLDAPPETGGRSTQLLSYDPSRTATMHRVAQALATSGEQPAEGVQRQPGQTPEEAALLAQQQGILGPVSIEVLDGMDTVVIRGEREDVLQTIQLIQMIESMSREHEPFIRIYGMQNANCTRVGTLVQELYDEVYSVRQGTVSITPLVKPNSLLLIGRQDSVATAMELVRRLDKPVSPDSEFQVFHLKHAAAETVRQQLEEFYSDREALGAEVRVTSDFRSNSVVVQACPRDLVEVAAMIMRIDTPTSETVDKIRIFPLKNALASELAPVLQDAITGEGTSADERTSALEFATIDSGADTLVRSGILTNVRITADTRSNALLISASEESMPLIEALIRQMDQLPIAEAQVKVFTIINSDASSLAEMLESLFGTSTTQTNQPAVRTGAQEGESTLVNLRFAVDVRTNSIIATGSEGDLTVVEAILLRLDEDDIQNRRVAVYRLLNAPAADVADAINEYLQNERQVEQATTGVTSTFETLEREVVVVPEDVSNSLIISTTPRYYNQITQIIEQLDERPPMVMLQVLIAEVDLDDAHEFGVEAGIQDALLFDRSNISNLLTVSQTTSEPGQPQVVTQQIISSDLDPGFAFNSTSPLGNSGSDAALSNGDLIGSQGISNFGLGRMNSELGFGGFVFSASSESVSFLIRALEQESRLEVLSRPQIMTLDGQPAFIQVGERVPTITGTQTNEAGMTNTITMEDVGLILGVTPRISPDGMVVMDIDAEKSAVGPTDQGIPVAVQDGVVIKSPRIETQTAQTTISAMDAQTVILGGLISRTKQSVHRKVPLLGDIPIVGHLFRFDSARDTRKELLIILTPRVVRTEQDMDMLKHVEASRMHWCMQDISEFVDDPTLRRRTDDWSDMDIPTIIHPEEIPAPEMRPLLEAPTSNEPTALPAPPITERTDSRATVITSSTAGPASSLRQATALTPQPAPALNMPTSAPIPSRQSVFDGPAPQQPAMQGMQQPHMMPPSPDATYGRSAVTRAEYREPVPQQAWGTRDDNWSRSVPFPRQVPPPANRAPMYNNRVEPVGYQQPHPQNTTGGYVPANGQYGW